MSSPMRTVRAEEKTDITNALITDKINKDDGVQTRSMTAAADADAKMFVISSVDHEKLDNIGEEEKETRALASSLICTAVGENKNTFNDISHKTHLQLYPANGSANPNFSNDRAIQVVANESIETMFKAIGIPRTTSTETNEHVQNIVQSNISQPAAKIVNEARDTTAASQGAQKPPADAQMKYVWGKGIVDWIKGTKVNNLDKFNVCYLCGQRMIRQNTNSIGDETTAWSYPEVEHKIPCTTAFMLFPSMDNLRWYYPYYIPTNGGTHRAPMEYRNRVNTKSMYESI